MPLSEGILLKPVPVLKRVTRISTEQTSMRTKLLKHIAIKIVQEHLLPKLRMPERGVEFKEGSRFGGFDGFGGSGFWAPCPPFASPTKYIGPRGNDGNFGGFGDYGGFGHDGYPLKLNPPLSDILINSQIVSVPWFYFGCLDGANELMNMLSVSVHPAVPTGL